MYMAILITKLNSLWHMDKLFYFGSSTTGNWCFRNGSDNAKHTFMKSWTAVDDIQKENDCSQIYMIKLCQKKKGREHVNEYSNHIFGQMKPKSMCLYANQHVCHRPEQDCQNDCRVTTIKHGSGNVLDFMNTKIFEEITLCLCSWILKKKKKWLPIYGSLEIK